LVLGNPLPRRGSALGTFLDDGANQVTTTDPAGAEARLFPTSITPTGADAISAYAWLTQRLAPHGYGDALAALHARSIATHPELAAIFRSPEAVEDVGVAAMQAAASTGTPRDVAAAEARERYKRAIAKQLAEFNGHVLSAPAKAFLADRAARDRAEADRLAAIEAERAAAEQAAAEERAAKLAEAARLAEVARAADAEVARLEYASADAKKRAYLALRAAVEARLRSSGLREISVAGGLYDTESLLAAGGGEGQPGLDVGLSMLRGISGALDKLEQTEARA
jgi:hypothetical protein